MGRIEGSIAFPNENSVDRMLAGAAIISLGPQTRGLPLQSMEEHQLFRELKAAGIVNPFNSTLPLSVSRNEVVTKTIPIQEGVDLSKPHRQEVFREVFLPSVTAQAIRQEF